MMKVINKKIEMLCYFKIDGAMVPQRFRIETQDQEMKVFKVKKIKKTDISKIAGVKLITFVCQYIYGNELKLCEIHYNMNSHQWFLFKA
jgi:hypothetical protein